MTLFGELIDIGLAFLIAAALAEYLKFRNIAKKGFNWLVLAGIFFLFSGTFTVTTSLAGFLGTEVWNGLRQLTISLGWLFALLATSFIVYESFIEK